MLNNFIYAKLKSLFEEKLAANEVPQEAIVFIEDTKEIWNHGTYFDGSTFDSSNIEASIKKDLAAVATSGSYTDLINRPEIPEPISESTITEWGFTKGNLTSVDIDEEVVESPEMEYATKGYVDNALAEHTTPEAELVVRIKQDGDNAELYNVKAKVTYENKQVELSSGAKVLVPVGEDVTVEFPKLEGYKRPDTKKFTMSENGNTVNAVYKGALVTLNVSTYDGSSADGQVVTVQKTVTIDCTPDYDRIDELGVAIMDIYGKFYRDADEWIAAGRPVPNGIAVSDGTHRFCIAMQGVENYDGYKALVEQLGLITGKLTDVISCSYKDMQTWGVPILYNGSPSISQEDIDTAKEMFDTNVGVVNEILQGATSSDEKEVIISFIKIISTLDFMTSVGEVGRDASLLCLFETFPNGRYGYLGSSGEWYLASTFNKKIDSLLVSIGGKALSAVQVPVYWTSTGESGAGNPLVIQCAYSDYTSMNYETGELIAIKAGTMNIAYGSILGALRAFCTLEPKHQTITTSERLVVKDGKVTFHTPYEAVNSVLLSDKDGYVTPERLEFQADGYNNTVNAQYGERTSMTIDYSFYAGEPVTIGFFNANDDTKIEEHDVSISGSQLLVNVEEGTEIYIQKINSGSIVSLSGDTTFTFTNGGTARITITDVDE